MSLKDRILMRMFGRPQGLPGRLGGLILARGNRPFARELALEELAAAYDGSERITRDQKARGIRGKPVTPAGADLLLQRLVDPGIDDVGGLGEIAFLSPRPAAEEDRHQAISAIGKETRAVSHSFENGHINAHSAIGAGADAG